MFDDYKQDVFRFRFSIMNDKNFADIDKLLKKIGKEVFIEILYPLLVKNKDIDIEGVARNNKRFAAFTKSSQRTRISNAKRLFLQYGVKDILYVIINSKRVDEGARQFALKYYEDL